MKPFMRYFAVSDRDVLARLMCGMKGPLKPNFADDTRENPDLYGPFWIATTLIFLTGVSSNISSYTDHQTSDKKHEDWDGDYTTIGEAALMYYIYLFGVGMILYFILRAYRVGDNLPHVWCIYGYAWAVYLPMLLCIALVQWLHDSTLSNGLTGMFAVVGSIYSGLFLVMNFRPEIEFMSRGYLLLAGMFVVHLIPGLVTAFYFH